MKNSSRRHNVGRSTISTKGCVTASEQSYRKVKELLALVGADLPISLRPFVESQNSLPSLPADDESAQESR